jgi:uncharacterized membrane protein
VYTVAVVLPVLGLIVLLLLLVEIRHYCAGRHLITRRRLVLRVVAGVLMLLLLAAVFVGLFVLHLRDAYARPQLFLAFWSSCVLAAVALVWVMLADMQEVEDRFTRRQHKLWEEMARFVADQIHSQKRGNTTPKGNDQT